ncbi:YlxQ-related RNA-binding protein [Vagococcus salmoninarum]|uniref:YlxQ-related RNA-binding protein n=1 Tax=Vagococcus salmoninarum TaxID=2739 RepID=UPI003F958704
MMNRQKALNLLGMATRAGKIVSGEELTINDIRNNNAKIVFVANDASDNTFKKIQDKSSYYKIPCVTEFTQAEISQAIGKHRMIVGVCDRGFAKKLQELLLS